MKKPDILVSHPGKQYVYQLVQSLQDSGYLNRFITSFWYDPENITYGLLTKIPVLGRFLNDAFLKRSQHGIKQHYVTQVIITELMVSLAKLLCGRNIVEKSIYYQSRWHDKIVTSLLGYYNPNMVIGYELSSLNTFREAMSKGIITVLDLSQVHYKFINRLFVRFPELINSGLDTDRHSNDTKIKEQELAISDYIIVLSNFAKDTLVNNGFDPERVFVSNPGYDENIFSEKKKDENGKFRILFVGSITKRKGLGILLESYRQLNLKNAELIIVGGMADAGDLMNKYRGLYKYHGYIRHEELNDLYGKADIFAFPSYLDSWAMVVLESMACGTPVIISENTGAKEVVIDGESGFIIPAGDIESLKDKILYFYNNRERVREMGKNAVKASKNYTWERYRKRISEIALTINDVQYGKLN